MHKERKRAEVRDRLRTAVVSGDLQLLSKRVMEGEEVGLTDNELQQARSVGVDCLPAMICGTLAHCDSCSAGLDIVRFEFKFRNKLSALVIVL